ncbi:MAG: NAD(P)H-dependent oxidoreductase subunit E [Candidatus Cloacimonetes bacterium]|nr:NAD(P)H-dependent oxidoreductase subunit E [Candidatus Cloacimonadota bacterium]
MGVTAGKDGLLYKRLKEVIDEKKNLQDPLIEVLREAQDIFGFLPIEVQEFVASELGLPIAEVYGVVTFYNFFSMVPQGKHIINVCTGTACYVKGADRIIKMMEEELGVKLGETTKDNLFTLSSVRCVGACSLAPVFVIGEDTYGRVDSRTKLVAILDKYRQ